LESLAMKAPLLHPPGPPSTVERLPNGLTLVVVDRPASHQVFVSLMVRAGSRFERPEESGISHFLEHILFRGNAAAPDSRALTLAFEEVGGMLNAVTGVEATEFYGVAHPDTLDLALSRLATFIREPIFAEVDKERQIILDEMLYDFNDRGELIDLATLSAQLLWPGHGLSQSITGSPETVAGLGEPELRAYHRGCYVPGNCVLALVGNVRAEQGMALARRHFSGWLAGASPWPAAMTDARLRAAAAETGPQPAPGPAIRTVADSDNQFHLQLSFPGPGYNAPEDLALSLLSRVLDDGPSSVLQRVVREERALVYGISGGYTAYCDAGQFDIGTSVKAERLEELLDCVLGELTRFCHDGPSAEEVERARRRHRYELEFGRDSLGVWAERYAWPLLYSSVRTEEEELADLSQIGTEELRDLAAKLFVPERLHLAVVGPLDSKSDATLQRAVDRFAGTVSPKLLS
jgi:predicted Zn-dependent peptidase